MPILVRICRPFSSRWRLAAGNSDNTSVRSSLDKLNKSEWPMLRMLATYSPGLNTYGTRNLFTMSDSSSLETSPLPSCSTLEDGDFGERGQVDADGDLGPQVNRQLLQDLILSHDLFVDVEVLVPAVDALAELLADVMAAQLVVREEDVVPVPEARDDIANVANNGGKHQHGNEQVCDHKQVLFLPLGQRGVSHRGENLGREPEAVKVLAAHGGERRVGHVGVHPAVAPEADVVGQSKVEAGVPVDQHEDVDHELGDAEGVGVGGSRLHAIQGLGESGDAEKSVDPHQRGLDAEGNVEEVGRQQGDQVPEEVGGVQVALPQLSDVPDEDALIQVFSDNTSNDLVDLRRAVQLVFLGQCALGHIDLLI
ncbi:hypothetical protein EYF80_044521 [Liparis tanakae]|uniref:Uncharacterized protein n=1 Tax=Liparis tanakae TaxID=230148 RepID=A0A4Z2FWJ2_9TELE|nr:hypothetical protein EYF80_044521 [Liparis tanakae]